MPPNRRNVSATTAIYVGALLTLGATVAPYVDRATGHLLVDHIRAGYPAYSQPRIDRAVTAYVVILTITGVLGLVGWGWSLWMTLTRRRWTRWPITAIFLIGVLLALTGLLTKDTSGDVGLAPALAWIELLPCLPGAWVVAQLWRRT